MCNNILWSHCKKYIVSDTYSYNHQNNDIVNVYSSDISAPHHSTDDICWTNMIKAICICQEYWAVIWQIEVLFIDKVMCPTTFFLCSTEAYEETIESLNEKIRLMREEFELEHQKMRESVLDQVLNRIHNTCKQYISTRKCTCIHCPTSWHEWEIMSSFILLIHPQTILIG